VSRVFPTAQFASIVYGAEGVSFDDPVERFHEASRLYPSVASARPEVLHELGRDGELARSVERSGRTHDHRPGVDLPAPRPLRGRLGGVIASRRSQRPDAVRPVRLRDLATVLAASYAAFPRGHCLCRPVPSAGALYPLETYVVAPAVTGVEPGTYHYDPFRHRLALLGRLKFADLRESLVDQSLADATAALVVVTGMFWRSRVKYGPRGYRFALLEAGHLAQNALLAATDLELTALPVGGFHDAALDRLVGADGLDESSLYAVVLSGGP
jgi:SagB-type dehydrogenase family enzyme